MLVWNVGDAEDATCGCGSWIAHWAKFGGQTTLSICSANGCYKVATVGARVAANGKAVIVPMCNLHHQQVAQQQVAQPVEVFDYAFAVSAELSRTCARPSLEDLGLGAFAGLPPHRFQAPVKVAGFLSGLTGPAEPAHTANPEEPPEQEIAGAPNGAVRRFMRRKAW